jgi:hypothetical protein
MNRSVLYLFVVILIAVTSCGKPGSVNITVTESGKAADVLSVNITTGDGYAHLSWVLPEGKDLKGVSVYRKSDSYPFAVGDGTLVYSGDALSFMDGPLANEANYYYLVVAIDNNLNFSGGVRGDVKISAPGNVYVQNTSGYEWPKYNAIKTGDTETTGTYFYTAGLDYNTLALVPSNEWRIEKRDQATGALVSSFGSKGISRSDPSTDDDEACGLVYDSNYLYVAGYAYIGSGYRGYVIRWDKNTGAKVAGTVGGSENGSWGSDATLQIIGSNLSISSSPLFSYKITSIISDGTSLYIGGHEFDSNGNHVWRIEKRNQDPYGNLVTSFNSTGYVMNSSTLSCGPGVILAANSGFEDQVNALCIDGNSLYAAGTRRPSGIFSEWQVMKFDKSTGVLDTTFNASLTQGTTAGIVVSDPITTDHDRLYAVCVDGNFIYLAGNDRTMGTAQWRIEKRDKTTGLLDSTFKDASIYTDTQPLEVAGVVTSRPSTSSAQINSLAIEGNYIFAAGNSGSYWRIEKRDKITGKLDATFGTNGVYMTRQSVGSDYLNAMTIDTGYMYVAGISGATDGLMGYPAAIISTTTGAFRSNPLVARPADPLTGN